MLNTAEELEAFLKPFKELSEKVYARKPGDNSKEAREEWEAYKAYVLANLQMPDFVTWDEPDPVYTIKEIHEGQYQLIFNDEMVEASDNVEYLYDLARHQHGAVIFDGEFKNFRRMGGSLMVPVLNDKGKKTKRTRLLISHTPKDHEYVEVSHYLEFLWSALAYLKNPNDFMNAWTFLDNHPFAWTRFKEDKNDWRKGELIQKMWLQPSRNEDGTITFMMEAGAAVPPERVTTYHDLRLDVYAPSFNEAIIEMAAKVHKFFNLDGSEREDVEYEKSKLELLLEERLAEAKEADEEAEEEN